MSSLEFSCGNGKLTASDRRWIAEYPSRIKSSHERRIRRRDVASLRIGCFLHSCPSNNTCSLCAGRTCPLFAPRTCVNVFARETDDQRQPAAIGSEGDASTRAHRRRRFAHRALFFRIQIYEGRIFRTISKSRTNSRILPPPPLASLPKPRPDRFFFLPLHRTRPLFVRKKKILSQLPFHAPHGSLRFFHSRLPYLVFPGSRILEIRTPLSTDRSRVQRPARPIRVTNSLFFFHIFFIYTYVLVRAFIRPSSASSPPARFLSFPSCSCVHRLAVEPSQCREKNFIENLLNGTTETGPGVTHNGFPSCPAGQFERAGPRIYVNVSIGHYRIPLATFPV